MHSRVSGTFIIAVISIVSIAFALPANGQVPASFTKTWEKSFGGSGTDYIYKVRATTDGGFILAGFSDSPQDTHKTAPAYGDTDAWLIKLDASGNKIWEKTFGGSSADVFTDVVQTSDGGFLCAGRSASGEDGVKTTPNLGSEDGWVLRVDPSGNKLWEIDLGGPGLDGLNAVVAASDGGFFLAGASSSPAGPMKQSSNNGSWDYWLVRLDALGNLVWDKSYGGSDNDMALAMAPTLNGGVVLCGASYSGAEGDRSIPSFGASDFWLVLVDSVGNKIWDNAFGGGSWDEAKAITQTIDGGFVVTGVSLSGVEGNKTAPNYGGGDHWVVKTDANGQMVWNFTFGGGGGEDGAAIAQLSDGSIFVAGFSESGSSTVKSTPNYGSQDFYVYQLDNDGNKLAEADFGGSSGDQPFSFAFTDDASIILVGESPSGADGNKTSANFGGPDGWVLKLSLWPAVDIVGPEILDVAITPNPAAVNVPLTLLATADESHTGGHNIQGIYYSIDGGPDIPLVSVDGDYNSPTESASASLTGFSAPGVHRILVRSVDALGNGQERTVLLAIFDPNGSFVTGAGSINSPPGAFLADTTLQGTADFAFVSRYKRGATIPTGSTEFQFSLAGLDFRSTSYQWLVVSGSHLKFKGVGTINGGGNFGFMITGTDGNLISRGTPDGFRIKIWDENNEGAVVYDSGLGTDDLSEATTSLSSGSIVIHK